MSEYKKATLLASVGLLALFLLGTITVAGPTLTKVSSATSTGSSSNSSSPLITLTETEYCFTGSSVNGSYYCSNSNSVMRGFTVYNETTITTTVVIPNGGFCCPPTNVSSPSPSSATFYWILALFAGLLSVLLVFFSLSKYSPIRLRISKLLRRSAFSRSKEKY
ncbi:MAG: hypothetical protein PXY39_10405 [archaeon]|nr:hypothetical protein [archaeon]